MNADEKIFYPDGVIAPLKEYYDRYDMKWLSDRVDSGADLTFVTFWIADPGNENREFSQWYQGKPFGINGRTYYTAEQYMMSEKALMFNDFDKYVRIMNSKDPQVCKQIGRELIVGFDGKRWGRAAREVVFRGNLGKFQSDASLMDKLLSTGDAVLVEASPLDNIYGAGLTREELLNHDGTLKVHPKDWHTKKKPTEQSESKLGFILMGLRDLFRDLMQVSER